jgi:nucleotide-binding universal stress UspA family protein
LAREVGHTSGQVRPLDPPTISRQLRGQAQRAERALAREARRYQVRWSFRVTQGAVGPELGAAAEEADLVVMGRSGWSGRGAAGSTVRAALEAGPPRTLLVEEGIRLQPQLLLLYDGTPNADRGLRTARILAKAREGYLTIVIVQPDAERALRLQRRLAEHLRGDKLELRFRWLLRPDERSLAALLASEPRCVVVVPADAALLRDRPLGDVLRALNSPVLIVR